VLKSVYSSLAEKELVTGDGLVYAIYKDKKLQTLIAEHLHLDIQQVGQLPDWLQNIVQADAQAEKGIADRLLKDGDADQLMKAVLSIQPIHDLAVSLYAGRILKDSLATARREFQDSHYENNFALKHKTQIDNYLTNQAAQRNQTIHQLAVISRVNTPITWLHNIYVHTREAAKNWGTSAAPTLPGQTTLHGHGAIPANIDKLAIKIVNAEKYKSSSSRNYSSGSDRIITGDYIHGILNTAQELVKHVLTDSPKLFLDCIRNFGVEDFDAERDAIELSYVDSGRYKDVIKLEIKRDGIARAAFMIALKLEGTAEKPLFEKESWKPSKRCRGTR